MQIPTFFLRTNMRLLVFQALVAWLSIRCHYLPIPPVIGFALTSTLSTYVNNAKDILDSRYGFILPLEAAYFLPAALEAYIVGSMPELAILLGTSPCDDRIVPRDPETNICVPEIAYQCQQYADMYAHQSVKGSLRIMESCWENYHTDFGTARKHHDRAHKHDKAVFLRLAGCMRAMEYWEDKMEVCGRTLPVRHCIAVYGAEDALAYLRQANIGVSEKEKTSEETSVGAGHVALNDGSDKFAMMHMASPCDHRAIKDYNNTNVCLSELAYHCYIWGEKRPQNDLFGLHVANACYFDYQVDFVTARDHHNSCHNHDDYPWDVMQVLACTHVMDFRKQETGSRFPESSVVLCIELLDAKVIGGTGLEMLYAVREAEAKMKAGDNKAIEEIAAASEKTIAAAVAAGSEVPHDSAIALWYMLVRVLGESFPKKG